MIRVIRDLLTGEAQRIHGDGFIPVRVFPRV